MSDLSVIDKMRKMELLQPETRESLTRPKVKSVTCELEFTRATAEKMFKSLIFEDEEETVLITEVLRPAKPGDPGVFFHSGGGVSFCVDHYELNGVEI